VNRFWILFGVFLLAGCQTVPPTGDAAWLYAVKPGATLRLNKVITMPAHTATVYLQGGRFRSYSSRDLYRPNCEFVVRTVAEKPRQVQPGDFAVTRVTHGEDYYAAAAMVAGLGISVGVGDASPSNTYNFVTELTLHSDSQPDVLYLSCAQVADYPTGEHITLGEFKQAVGSYFTLIPAAR
jgi:hypothetical protein